MHGRTVVITGATSGIGAVAARRLAERGARIVFIARDRERADQALHALRAVQPGAAHAAFLADLSRLADMRRVGEEIAAAEPRIDVLLNNAGMITFEPQRTEDGLERMFATNHLAYFVLTGLLLKPLQAAGAARIVSTASEAHRGRTFDISRLQEGAGMRGYGVTKLCNILFTRELARRLAGTGVTANCLHPGFVATRFGDDAHGLARAALRVAKRLFATSEERGAETLLYLASAPEVAGRTGEYFIRCAPAAPSREAQNEANARALWEHSQALAGAVFDRP